MDDLKGKVALITGSTSGIGRAAAVTLAKNGTKVTVTGRERIRGEEVVAEIAAVGGEAIFVQADLTDADTPSRLVAQTMDRWGKLDIVINNAAVVCNKPLEEVNHQDWDRLFTINLKAPFFLVQAALPSLEKSKGVILNISSINRWNNGRNNLVYDSMKACLNHMTRGLALDLREKGIRANVLMPGGVATPLLLEWFEQQHQSKEAALQAYEKADGSRLGKPQQIADLIAMMVSDQASWVNGAEIPVDGGYFLG